MSTTRKLSLVFVLDNNKDCTISLSDPKEDLTKTQTDEVMQDMLDKNAILKDGHALSAIKQASVTTTTVEVLA